MKANKLYGRCVYPGITYGEIYVIRLSESYILKIPVPDPEAEITRFTTALEKTNLQLENIYHKTYSEYGEKNAAIFEAQRMILDDENFKQPILEIISKQAVNAEYAIALTKNKLSRTFTEMDDEYIKDRADDLKDVTKRLLRILQNTADDKYKLPEQCIIVADDLTAGDIIHLDRNRVLAIVLRYGSIHSHAAILTRAMNIPVIINVPLPQNIDGQFIIVNSRDGFVSINPVDDEIKKAKKLIIAETLMNQKLRKLRGQTSETKSGRKISLLANIGGLHDLETALQNDAEGVGLFRSEFLYMEKNDFPTEDEQFEVYKQATELMNGKLVAIRTLDVGSDKHIGYLKPAPGSRGIRFSLEQENIFRIQLRAIYRASAFGSVGILIPMVISPDEVKKVKTIINEIKDELTNEGVPFGTPGFGIMIETPAAVILADELAKEVDYFSIGTNDLTRHTLAADGFNPDLEMIYNPHHPAVIEMIKLTVSAAKRAGINVGICGEMAANPEFIEDFLDIGVDGLSVLPSLIFPLRKRIRELD